MRFQAPLAAATLALLAAGLAAGCGKSTNTLAPTAATTTSQNESAITSVMASVPALAEDDLFMSEEQTQLSAAANAALGRTATPESAIRPWRFWRRITGVTRTFDFEFFAPDSNGDPTRATVTIHKRLTGTFNIATPDTGTGGGTVAAAYEGDDPADSTGWTIVHKPLMDHWRRRVALVRVDRPNDRHVWRIAGTSGVRVTSVAPDSVHAPATRITSLRIQKADLDTTITDPLQLFRLRQILQASPGQQVQLTVTTDADDDVVVLVHRGMRFLFHNDGGGTYSGTWIVPRVGGIHHFGVNALSHGTLFDDQAPYASDAWLLPYVTVPMDVDEMP